MFAMTAVRSTFLRSRFYYVWAPPLLVLKNVICVLDLFWLVGVFVQNYFD